MRRSKQQQRPTTTTINDIGLSPSSQEDDSTHHDLVTPDPYDSLSELPTYCTQEHEDDHPHAHPHEDATTTKTTSSPHGGSKKKKSTTRHRHPPPKMMILQALHRWGGVPSLVRALVFGAFCFMLVAFGSLHSLHNSQTSTSTTYSAFHPVQRSKSSPYVLLEGSSSSSFHGYYFSDMVLPKRLGVQSVTFPLVKMEFDESDDYGGLNIFMFEEEGMKRAVYHDFSLDEGKNDRKDPEESGVDAYYAFDDDEVRNPYRRQKGKEGKRCRRTRFHRRRPINCNTMYELDLRSIVENQNSKYLGGGSYRDVYLIEKFGLDDNPFVYKTSGPSSKFKYTDYEFIRMDCLVLELFSSSPLIANSYMYCGLDQIGDAMLHGDFESKAVPNGGRKKNFHLNDSKHLDPKNSLTPTEKLRYALEMAEPLALLHGFYGGVLVHDDIQVPQYLLTADGHLKLNDFNRAEFMLWNEEDQEYCKYQNNEGHGDWRAPEEYFDDPLDEQIDVFSYGNNLYCVLTGLYPFYTADAKTARNLVKRGEKPFIDPRWRNNSFAEGKIVELIERCWPFKAEDRITIFEAVKFLRDAVAENERRIQMEGKHG